MLCAVTANYAQTSASQSGIAVQGIARGEDNTALVSQVLSLKFTFYYLDASSLQQVIYSTSKSVTTDAFGVFSVVIDPTAVNNGLFANKAAYLKIEKGGEVISDEQLHHVPYAISANNGVPTGSIMPYTGTTAPQGWVLCDGRLLPNPETTSKDLIAMLGKNTAPNLMGMFLRGTGTAETGKSGPALLKVQQDDTKSHSHGTTALETTTTGRHNHDNGEFNRLLRVTGSKTSSNTDSSAGEPDLTTAAYMSDAGDHKHKISGNVDSTGGTETRPINFGVNYIIKL